MRHAILSNISSSSDSAVADGVHAIPDDHGRQCCRSPINQHNEKYDFSIIIIIITIIVIKQMDDRPCSFGTWFACDKDGRWILEEAVIENDIGFESKRIRF